MKRLFLLSAAAVILFAACTKEHSDGSTTMSFSGPKEISFTASDTSVKKVGFSTDWKWNVEVSSEAASWLSASPTSGDPAGSIKMFTLTVSAQPNSTPTTRTATVRLLYGDSAIDVKVSQAGKGALAECSQFEITPDMIFSTTLGANDTNVAQGFDYDPDEDVIYITQKYGTYRNHIGWQKRENASSTTKASNKMTLSCFSHGNNIAIQKMADGKKFVWAPNYGTRQDDGSYDAPVVVSRFPLQAGQTILNDETTENYFFDIKPCWPAFDFKNDLVAICNYKKFWVYRLSDLQALPEETITLPYTITYGGSSPVDTKRAEYSGSPTIKARNCSKVSPLYTVTFDYSSRGLHWQSYCIDNGWIYAILQADKKAAPAIIYDTYVECYKMDGSRNLYKIRQEYMQNRDAIVSYDWNEASYFYCEPEGIKVIDNVLYTMYTIRGENSNHLIRRPVVFKLANPVK